MSDYLVEVLTYEIRPGDRWLLAGEWVRVLAVDAADRVAVTYEIDGESHVCSEYRGFEVAVVKRSLAAPPQPPVPAQEEDEDPAGVRAAFDRGPHGITAPPSMRRVVDIEDDDEPAKRVRVIPAPEEQPEHDKTESDLHDIERIFTKAGIGYSVDRETDDKFPTTQYQLTLAGGISDHTPMTAANMGYFGFFTAMGFDENGALLWVGAWE